MTGYSSALRISAAIIEEHAADPTTARRLITEQRYAIETELARQPQNFYLENMATGFRTVLDGLYIIAGRGK